MDKVSAYDLLVIGGGINGAGIARDAAGRGLRVLLCEQGDLANYTSSASTKLIHGGLRYLEYRDFGLVRKALKERETLLRMAPHIIWPLRFVMPHVRGLRPAWMIRAGLFLYDHLGGREQLSGSAGIDLHRHRAGAALAPRYTHGFVYSDCRVQDARLAVLTVMDAAHRGACIMPRTRCLRVRRDADSWRATLASTVAGDQRFEVNARALVNAAGPWAGRILQEATQVRDEHVVKLIKGSHIIVPRLFEHDYAYVFQHTDRRIIFAIPYESDFTLIGTTDVEYSGDPGAAVASDEEISYLCAAISRYLQQAVTPDKVVANYAGVRALYDEHHTDSATAISRDYRLDFRTGGGAPLLSVLGGKITTHRILAEQAVDHLSRALGHEGKRWTATVALPGGDIPDGDLARYLETIGQRHPWLPRVLAKRLARNYGTRIEYILAGASNMEALGEHFGQGLYASELHYLVKQEWARSCEDILWRRTKLGLKMGSSQAARVAAWLAENYGFGKKCRR